MSWKIYKYTAPNGKCYIGQTKYTTQERAKDGYKDCTAFVSAIAKYGWENFTCEILEDNITTQEQANEREIYWIAFYHSYVHDPQSNGYNLTKGGKTSAIFPEPVLMIDKSLKVIQEFPSLYEAAQALRLGETSIHNAIHGIKMTAGGYYWCYKKDYTNNWSPRPYRNGQKQIYKISPQTLNILEQYESAEEAARKNNISSASNIIQCCKGNYTMTHGYYWCYVDRWFSGWKPVGRTKYLRQVVCIETQEIFLTAKEAGIKYQISPQVILACCAHKKGYKTADKKHWVFLEEYATC